MGEIKVLVFDIDGSVMPQGGPMDPKVADLCRRLQEAGLKIGPATGKNGDYCRGMACGAGVSWNFIIAETGAHFLETICASPPAFYQHDLSEPGFFGLEKFLLLINYRQYERTFRFYTKNERFRPELKQGIITFFPAGTDTEKTVSWVPYFKEIIKSCNIQLKVQRHSDGAIDVVPWAVSKALGIEKVCEIYSIRPENIVTVVDGVNDIELTQNGVKPIAVGNSVEEIKAAVIAAGGYVAKKKFGDGFIEGMRTFAESGCFSDEVAAAIMI